MGGPWLGRTLPRGAFYVIAYNAIVAQAKNSPPSGLESEDLMRGSYQPSKDFGLSWGFAGFRIGRSQYGTWWVSVGLPFGFRVTRRLGRQHDPTLGAQQPTTNFLPATTTPVPSSQPSLPPPATTRNQKILEQMRSNKP